MANYTKEQLTGMNDAELHAISAELNVNVEANKSREDLIYDILDAQAEATSSDDTASQTPKRRTRIVKKSDADHVFSTNLSPVKTDATQNKEQEESVVAEADSINDSADVEAKTEPIKIELPKRKRGRPSKADIAAREAAIKAAEEAAIKASQEETSQNAQDVDATQDVDKTENGVENSVNVETEFKTETRKTDDIPDFVAEQMKQANEIAGIQNPDVLDMEEVKRTLGRKMPEMMPASLNNLPKVTNTESNLNNSEDFVIVQDVPVVYEGTELNIPQNDYVDNQTQEEYIERPRFRRFKDDPIVQEHLRNDNNLVSDEDDVEEDFEENEEVIPDPTSSVANFFK